MVGKMLEKLKSRSGRVSRLTVLLAVFCIIAVGALIFYPMITDGIRKMRANECALAPESAQRKIGIDANLSGSDKSIEEIKAVATQRVKDWEDLCPDGGTVYIVPSDGAYAVKFVCGMHGGGKERAYLNADNCLGQIRAAIKAALGRGEPVPETVEVSFNSQTYTAVLVSVDPDINHGTDYYKELKGVVIRFAVAGDGGFGDGFGQKSGAVSFFVFADESYCAKWDNLRGWTGDAVN